MIVKIFTVTVILTGYSSSCNINEAIGRKKSIFFTPKVKISIHFMGLLTVDNVYSFSWIQFHITHRYRHGAFVFIIAAVLTLMNVEIHWAAPFITCLVSLNWGAPLTRVVHVCNVGSFNLIHSGFWWQHSWLTFLYLGPFHSWHLLSWV